MKRRRLPKQPSPTELEFQGDVLLALGARADMRLWRQNVGSVPVRNEKGVLLRYFHAGPPTGASDLSGILRPEGWRIELEFKSADGERSPEQERWAALIEGGGGVYALLAYDARLSSKQNVLAAVAVVEAAIARRRAACP